MWLSSGIAVAAALALASSYSFNSSLSLGTSICYRYATPPEKKLTSNAIYRGEKEHVWHFSKWGREATTNTLIIMLVNNTLIQIIHVINNLLII